MNFKQKIKYLLKRRRRVKRLEKKHQSNTPKEISIKKSISLVFNSVKKPIVSIIIPFYNEIDYTINCLQHLNKNISNKYSYEIILIDDNSTESYDFSNIKNITVIKNENNLGFLKNVNIGINQAKGEYIYLLNNDTEVQEFFLDELFYVFENFKNVGAVGSMLINSDQTLQEAGAVFLKNMEIHQIFHKKKKYYPEINYISKVDYCSGCSLLFKKYNNKNELNLLDEQFIPAYFEETDLCFSLKHKQNKNIYYTPFSKVLHYNGVSYNKKQKSNIDKEKQKQLIFDANRIKFSKKWKNEIDKINTVTIPARITEIYNNKSIIFFSMVIPEFDKDSGSNRLKEIMISFLNKGYHVTLIVNNNYHFNEYNLHYQKLGILVYYEYKKDKNYLDFIKNHCTKANITWFYGADAFSTYYKKIKDVLEDALFVFDMVDIHHLRHKRAIEIEKNKKLQKKLFKKYEKIETEQIKKADFVITISDSEKKYMKKYVDVDKILTISNIHYPKIEKENRKKFNQRKDLLFIGSTHQPNIDSLYFLYEKIMPKVWKIDNSIKVNIVGNVNTVIKDITDERFIFHGYVPSVDTLFNDSRIMVVPLRYGAGVKGKIGQSLEYYLPVITTKIGGEGMFLKHQKNALIADNPTDFSKEILKLYNDENLWNILSENSEKSLKPFSLEQLNTEIQKLISFTK